MGRRRKLPSVQSQSSTSSNESDSTNRQFNDMQRNAANDRERARMRVLSKAFVRLKTTLPWVPNDTKLSKLDTLRLACSYISYLSNVLNEDEESQDYQNACCIDGNTNTADFEKTPVGLRDNQLSFVSFIGSCLKPFRSKVTFKLPFQALAIHRIHKQSRSCICKMYSDQAEPELIHLPSIFRFVSFTK